MTGLLAVALRDSEERRLSGVVQKKSRTCGVCPKPLPPHRAAGRPRVYCSAACQSEARRRRSAQPGNLTHRQMVEALTARIIELEAQVAALGGAR